jgi:hypothetical protein
MLEAADLRRGIMTLDVGAEIPETIQRVRSIIISNPVLYCVSSGVDTRHVKRGGGNASTALTVSGCSPWAYCLTVSLCRIDALSRASNHLIQYLTSLPSQMLLDQSYFQHSKTTVYFLA